MCRLYTVWPRVIQLKECVTSVQLGYLLVDVSQNNDMLVLIPTVLSKITAITANKAAPLIQSQTCIIILLIIMKQH